MSREELRKYFEEYSLTEEHQEFVLKQTKLKGQLIQKGKHDIVKFLLSDNFIDTRIGIAEIILQNPPEKAAILISQFAINFSFGLLSDRDELG